jgi:hypothetical protein
VVWDSSIDFIRAGEDVIVCAVGLGQDPVAESCTWLREGWQGDLVASLETVSTRSINNNAIYGNGATVDE